MTTDDRGIKAVLFDLDGTLGDRKAAVRRWAETFYFSQPGVMAQVDRQEAIDKIIEWDAGGQVYAPKLFERVVEEWPWVRDSAADLVEWHRREYPAAFRATPEMTGLINRIMHAGIPWGVVTNGPPFQRDKLVALGIEILANCVLVSGEFGAAKPDVAIFNEALRLMPSRPGETLFVGDAPAADIEGARSAGMRTAWLSHGRKWPEKLEPPTHVIASIGEVAELLGLKKKK